MSLAYRLMYLVGFTPWDNDEVPRELEALVEGEHALEPAHALDIGCGTGTQASTWRNTVGAWSASTLSIERYSERAGALPTPESGSSCAITRPAA